jgi:AcrR family transcriptional regulator
MTTQQPGAQTRRGADVALARPAPATKPTPGRRGRPVDGSSEETRARVLDAARHAFATQGFSGATMRAIAAEAGVTAMALYNYAPSKAALFEMVWQASIASIYTDYEAAVAGRDSLLDEVDALLDHSREVLDENPDHIRFVMRMLLEREHVDLAATNLQVHAVAHFFGQLAQRSVKRGEISRRERDRLVTFITTLLWGITTMTAFDAASLNGAVEAAKWAFRRQLESRAFDPSRQTG